MRKKLLNRRRGSKRSNVPSTCEPPPDNLDKLQPTARRYAKALHRTGGVVAEVAKMLRVSRQAVNNMISRYPELARIRDDARASLADLAYVGLRRAAASGDMGAIRVILLNTTFGRDLGFNSRIDLAVESMPTIKIVHMTPKAENDAAWEAQARAEEERLRGEMPTDRVAGDDKGAVDGTGRS